MDAPLIVVDTYAVKEGQLDGLKQFLRDLFGFLEQSVPGLLSVNAFLSADGTEAAVVRVHADAGSLPGYWRALHQHTGQELRQFVTPTGTQAYGELEDAVL